MKYAPSYAQDEARQALQKVIELHAQGIIRNGIYYIVFPDILSWRDEFQKCLDLINNHEPYVLRTCIHVGEVSLNGVNPVSLAISQTFKMEKAIRANQIGLTETAYNIAWPTISKSQLRT